MKNERDVKRVLKRGLDKHGIWHTSPYQAGMTQYGVPDVLACANGFFVGLECKFGNNTPTKHQTRQMDAIKNSGGMAFIVNETNVSLIVSMLADIQKVSNDN